ncbi:hypothetical protein CAPTEDRAFT_214625 [Capitella teleta]|uniref:F-box domain-containing protein n=1 Tax=Capitella teleta TaxID=283909 RepID=R7UGB8_CAPTE|nr:hypothetical protein CAPTEDRAFT_214625 [Capitella teleta]|eukprot:ELU05123.1 hypothetical protein CAPTEDRAFT_214625 [Capitella teleta]
MFKTIEFDGYIDHNKITIFSQSKESHSMNTFDLRCIFRCKKPRRSQRLEIKDISEVKSQTVQQGALGFLELVPLELKFLIFSYLPVEDLSQLTITSKCLRNLVELYRNSGRYQKFLIPQPVVHSAPINKIFEHTELCNHFKKLGLLVKRSTCLYSTKERLKLMHQFLRKYHCSNQEICCDPTRCVSLLCFGRFLHTVLAGWDDHECIKAFDVITQSSGMMKNLHNLLNAKPGAYSDLELRTRLFFRRVFIGQHERGADRAFWLHLILKAFPMVHQARVLFLLFGPISSDKIQWYEMSERTPVSKEEALLCFSDLANAFRVLHCYSKDWTEDTIISVIDEVTSGPDDWLSENMAHLLFLCGDRITTKVLCSKAINGRVNELCDMVPSLCLICCRHEQPMSWVINVVRRVAMVMENPKERLQFLHGIVDMFRDILISIHYLVETDDNAHEFQLMLEAQGAFTKEIILMGFKDIVT